MTYTRVINTSRAAVNSFRQCRGQYGHAEATVLQSLADWVFGYDYFISYAWADGRAYAVELARRLREEGFVCFLDSEEYVRGDDWRAVGRRAIRKSSNLALLITQRSLQSEPVLSEVRTFVATKRRLIPIALTPMTYTDSKLYDHLGRDLLVISETADQQPSGPSAETLAALRVGFERVRQHQRRARVLWSAALLLLALLILAAFLWQVSEARRRTAHARALSAASLAEQRRFPDLALLLAARADEIDSTLESRNALATTLTTLPTERFAAAGGAIWRMEWADAGTVVTGGAGGAVSRWRLAEGTRGRTSVVCPSSEVSALAIDAAGVRMAIGCFDGSLAVVDVTSFAEQRRVICPGAVRSLAWIGSRLVVSNDASILETLEREADALTPLPSPHKSPPLLLTTPDAKGMYAAGSDRRLTRWSGELRIIDDTPVETTIASLALSPDGRWLALGTYERGVELWTRTPQVMQAYTDGGASERVMAAAFSADSKRLFWGGDGGELRVVDLEGGKVSTYPVGADALVSIAVNAEYVVSAARNGVLWIGRASLDTSVPLVRERWELQADAGLTSAVQTESGWVVGDNAGGVMPLVDGVLGPSLTAHASVVRDLVHLPTQGLICASGEEARIATFTRRAGQLEARGELVAPSVVRRLIRFGEGIAVITDRGEVLRSDGTAELQSIGHAQQAPPNPFSRTLMAATDDATHIAVGHDVAAEVLVLDARSGVVTALGPLTSGLGGLAFSPDGLLATMEGDRTTLWDPESATRVGELRTGPHPPSQLAFVGPTLLALTTGFGELGLWDVVSGQQVGTWMSMRGELGLLVAESATQSLTTFSHIYDSSTGKLRYWLRTWELDVEQWRRRAREVANRELDPTERQRFDE